jgi:hypothetical protein
MHAWMTADGDRIEIITEVGETVRTSFRVTGAAGTHLGDFDTVEQLMRIIDLSTVAEQPAAALPVETTRGHP